MAERNIQPVADNRDKQRTYREQIQKYNRAMQYEFYFEAIMIDYALLEDRLHSMIYHFGLLADRNATAIWKQQRPALVEMVTACFGEKEAAKLGIGNITGKMKIVRSVARWASAAEEPGDKYLAALASRCREMDLEGLNRTLDGIAAWCGYRNEIVHAMMNKNMDSLSEALRERAEEGMHLARALDAQVRIAKDRNRIRRSAGL